MDLSGAADTTGQGITQTLTTTVGQLYQLDYQYWNGNPNYTGALSVLVNNVVVANSVSTTSPTFVNGTSVVFSGTGSDVITFLAAGGQASLIDNVSVVPVPEPASMAVLGLGLAALRRRRAKK